MSVYEEIVSCYGKSMTFISNLLERQIIKLKDIPQDLRINDVSFYRIASHFMMYDVNQYIEFLELVKADFEYSKQNNSKFENIYSILINDIEEAKFRYEEYFDVFDKIQNSVKLTENI